MMHAKLLAESKWHAININLGEKSILEASIKKKIIAVFLGGKKVKDIILLKISYEVKKIRKNWTGIFY